MLSLADPPQSETGPGRRLDPGESALRPRPTEQPLIDVAAVVVLAVRLLSLACQQCGRRLLKRSLLVAERRLGEENERRRPDRFRPAAFETIRPLAESALTQPVAAGLDDGGKALGMTRQSKKGEAGRFQMGGLIGSVAPSAARDTPAPPDHRTHRSRKNPPEKGRRHPVEV